MSDELSKISKNGITVVITRTDGMRVTADTDIKAGTTWSTSEINHLSLQSGINGFLNAALDRRTGDAGADLFGEEIGCSDQDLRITVSPKGVTLLYVNDEGEHSEGRLKEMEEKVQISKLKFEL